MYERERLHTRYLSAAWLGAVKAARQISSPTSGTGESVHATSSCEMELRSQFYGNLHRIFARKKRLFMVFKRTKSRIYCHFLFVAFSAHCSESFLTYGAFSGCLDYFLP